jgi:hypothetical protein
VNGYRLIPRTAICTVVLVLSSLGCAPGPATPIPSPSTEVATRTQSPTPITPAPSMPEPLKATVRACKKNGMVVVTVWVTNERQSPSGLIWFDVKTWAFDEGSVKLGKNAQKWYRLSDALYPSQPTWASIQGVAVQPLAKQKFMFTVIGGRSNLAVIGGVTIKASEGVFGDRAAFGYFSDERC